MAWLEGFFGTSTHPIIIASTGVLSMLLLLATVLTYDVFSARASLDRELGTLAEVVGANCVSPLIFDDETFAESALTSLRGAPRIQRATIYKNDGAVFVHYCAPEVAADDSAGT